MPNAHHHPPEEAFGRVNNIAPGRVHDDVRPPLHRQWNEPRHSP